MKIKTNDIKTYRREYMRKYRKEVQGRPTSNDIHREQFNTFLDVSNIRHKGKYDYTLISDKPEDFKLCTKYKIICPIHGIFEQIAGSHMHGQGCYACGRLQANRNKCHTNEWFKEQCALVHNTKYLYPQPYSKLKEKIKIICPTHGNFFQTPQSHILQKQGCPVCANEKRALFQKSSHETNIENWLLSHAIQFKFQKQFDDCRFDVQPLRYDFFLPEFNVLLEYNGEQHYKYVKRFHKTEDVFLRQQERDKYKEQYAIKNGYVFWIIHHNHNTIQELTRLVQDVNKNNSSL